MCREFKGRVVLSGELVGDGVVTHQGLNLLASFQKSVLRKADKVICFDQNNPELYKKNLTDKIICLPRTIGSTTGGMILETTVKMGIAPKAMLFSQHIDSLAVAGIILSDVWLGERIVTIDQLGDEFLEYVKDGMVIEIKEDGKVLVK